MTHEPEDNSVPMSGPQEPTLPRIRPKFAGLSSSAVAFFRLGTYQARMAAALMIVAGGLLYQTGAQAMEQSSKKVLYLDAPSVSVSRAEKAGETARGYAGPDSNVDDAVLGWVRVKPVPQEARKAFASITEPSGQSAGGVSYEDATAAGDTMVAQLGGDSPASPVGEDDELAAADPVRPNLGDGTKAADSPAADGADQQSPADPKAPMASGSPQPGYAAADPQPSDLGLPAPMAEEYAPPEPSAEQHSDHSGNELAAVSENVSEGTGDGADSGTSDTGPISDVYSPENAAPDQAAGQAVPAGTESGSPDSQGDENSPEIIVPDFGIPADESEPEYAEAQEGSGAAAAQPPSEPSPAPAAEEPGPAQKTSPESDEQEAEETSDVVAVVPYDGGESQNESQEGQEQSPKSPVGLSNEPSSDESEAYSPDPEPAEFDTELGAGVDQDTGEEPPEGVQIESSDEAGAQKLSVVVHQESSATEDAPESPVEPELPEQEGSGGSSQEPQRPESQPSGRLGNSPNPDEKEAPQSGNAGQPDSGRPNGTSGRHPDDHRGTSHNTDDNSTAPRQAPGDEQQSAPQKPAGPDQGQPETTPEPGAGNESSEPEAAPVDRGQQGDRRPDQNRLSRQEPRTSTPAPAPAPKDETPRRNTEGKVQRAPANNRAQNFTRNQDPQPSQRQDRQPIPQPSKPVREPQPATSSKVSEQETSPQGSDSGAGVARPMQSAGAVRISAPSDPRPEPEPVQESQFSAETASPVRQQNSHDSIRAAPVPQNQPAATPVPDAQRAARRTQIRAQRQAARREQRIAARQAATEVTSASAPSNPAAMDPATGVNRGTADVQPAVLQERRAARRVQRISARQASQITEPVRSQIPVQQAGEVTQDYVEPAVEQNWDQTVQPANKSAQGEWGADTGVPAQDAAADPASDSEPEIYGTDVPSTSQGATSSSTKIYEDPAPAETYKQAYTEPVAQVPTQQLEPVEQVALQELEPAPQAASTVDTTVQKTITTGGGE